MSRRWQHDVLRWMDGEGTMHEHVSRSKRSGGLAGIPKRFNLVSLYCPSGHLVAIVSPNGPDAPPLVMIDSPAGVPAPQLVVLPDGLAGAVVSYDEDGPHVHDLGVSEEPQKVLCLECLTRLTIEHEPIAAELDAYRGTPRRIGLAVFESA